LKIYRGNSLNREEKENFIRDNWEIFENPEDTVSLPDLRKMDEKQLDTMIIWYEYLLNK